MKRAAKVTESNQAQEKAWTESSFGRPLVPFYVPSTASSSTTTGPVSSAGASSEAHARDAQRQNSSSTTVIPIRQFVDGYFVDLAPVVVPAGDPASADGDKKKRRRHKSQDQASSENAHARDGLKTKGSKQQKDSTAMNGAKRKTKQVQESPEQLNAKLSKRKKNRDRQPGAVIPLSGPSVGTSRRAMTEEDLLRSLQSPMPKSSLVDHISELTSSAKKDPSKFAGGAFSRSPAPSTIPLPSFYVPRNRDRLHVTEEPAAATASSCVSSSAPPSSESETEDTTSGYDEDDEEDDDVVMYSAAPSSPGQTSVHVNHVGHGPTAQPGRNLLSMLFPSTTPPATQPLSTSSASAAPPVERKAAAPPQSAASQLKSLLGMT